MIRDADIRVDYGAPIDTHLVTDRDRQRATRRQVTLDLVDALRAAGGQMRLAEAAVAIGLSPTAVGRIVLGCSRTVVAWEDGSGRWLGLHPHLMRSEHTNMKGGRP